MSKPILFTGIAKLHRNCSGMCGWRVWYIGTVWFLVECSLYGILFWSNKLIKSFLNFGQSSLAGPCPAAEYISLYLWMYVYVYVPTV
jgi:hypothetical protein